MAFRELTMIDVREVLRRLQAAQSVRRIARDGVADRKTVGRYAAAAAACGLEPASELTDELVHRVAERVQRREAAGAVGSEPLRALAPRIRAWLEGEGGGPALTLQKVHTLLARQGVEVAYPTLWRFARHELGWRRPALTMRLPETPPGQVAQMDFGCMGRVVFDGRPRSLWALVITLTFSRYLFVWPTFEQTTASVITALEAAWRFFGGMARVLVPDNLKAVVHTPDAVAPKLVDAFQEYVQARGLFVDPARVRKPRDKARVENGVAYVRERWFAGEVFAGLDEARARAEGWCRDEAGMRMHGTTRRLPREAYEGEERPHMLPPPEAPYDVPHWSGAKVHPDHHVQVLRALSSVPHRYVGQSVRVRADGTTVRIYLGTELVKLHPRQPPGGRSTDEGDYAKGKAAYATRGLDALTTRAQQRGAHVGRYVERRLEGPLPWGKMRQAYRLLSLCDRYGDGVVEAVCQSALAFDVVDVVRVERKLQSATALAAPGAPEARAGKVVRLPTPRFARDEAHFATRPRATTEGT
jgi:hypothetical protein